jgi:hypothetical protein
MTNDSWQVDGAMMGLRDLLYSEHRLDEALDAYRPGISSLHEADPGLVLGVVAEIGMERGAVIVAGFANGDARLLYTTGGGIIGDLTAFPKIAAAAKAFVGAAQPLATTLPLETAHPLPAPGRVRFALLTPGGTRVADVSEAEMDRPTAELRPVIAALNDLITELRTLDESSGKR